jgi:signal transduction histidine kinase/ActR/RegA family two-component response regulator
MLDTDPEAIFPGGGAAGAVLRSTDWSKTALGPMDGWPISLKTSVRAMLHTRQPTCLFWGPELVNLYNDGFIPILGEKHPAAMGQRAEDCWRDAWPVVGALLNDVVAKGEAFLYAEMLVPIVRQGRLGDAWWNYSYSPVFGDDGNTVGVLVVATETTAEVLGRKELEAANRQTEFARQELQGVFMQAPFPMAILNGPEHRFSLANGPYQAFVGRDVLGKKLREAFTLDEVGYYLPILDRVYQTGAPSVVQDAPLRLADANGVIEERFIDVGYHPHRHADGSIAGVLVVVHDVTARVTARLHTENRLEERAQMHAREASLRQIAEAANRAKDEFLATVSHELRTPLNAILGWSAILRESTDAVRLEKGLTVIGRNARAQAKIIEDILDVSRIISGKVVLELRRVPLATVIHNAVESVRPAAVAKHIDLRVDLAEAAISFIADEDRLQQVVWNLLSNAVKFTPSGGQVKIKAAREGSRISIEVTDSGKGISPEFLPHVFERFRQDDASTTKRYGGLGLGLAIVRHLVELHGGTVRADSAGEGHGATFEVVLPIRAVEPVDKPSPVPQGSPRHSERPAKHERSLAGVHVLVVDDEADAREILAAVLQDAGATVTEASSASAAMNAIATEGISVVVSDIGMPMEDGYTFMTRLRAQAPAEKRRVPSLALTAYARAEDRARALTAGFDEHVAKPVDPTKLVRAVVALVRR